MTATAAGVVETSWEDRHGPCADCGLPAAYLITDVPAGDARVGMLACAVCAAWIGSTHPDCELTFLNDEDDDGQPIPVDLPILGVIAHTRTPGHAPIIRGRHAGQVGFVVAADPQFGECNDCGNMWPAAYAGPTGQRWCPCCAAYHQAHSGHANRPLTAADAMQWRALASSAGVWHLMGPLTNLARTTACGRRITAATTTSPWQVTGTCKRCAAHDPEGGRA